MFSDFFRVFRFAERVSSALSSAVSTPLHIVLHIALLRCVLPETFRTFHAKRLLALGQLLLGAGRPWAWDAMGRDGTRHTSNEPNMTSI